MKVVDPQQPGRGPRTRASTTATRASKSLIRPKGSPPSEASVEIAPGIGTSRAAAASDTGSTPASLTAAPGRARPARRSSAIALRGIADSPGVPAGLKDLAPASCVLPLRPP